MKNNNNTDNLFEQMTNISKAHAYDILVELVKGLKASNDSLVAERDELKEALQNLIKTATDTTANLCGFDGADELDNSIDKAKALLNKQ